MRKGQGVEDVSIPETCGHCEWKRGVRDDGILIVRRRWGERSQTPLVTTPKMGKLKVELT